MTAAGRVSRVLIGVVFVASGCAQAAAPATQAPATQAPATQAPATQAPATQAPATQAPATAAPTVAPATEAPATEAPATEVPATEAPSEAATPAASEGAETPVVGGTITYVTTEPPTLNGIMAPEAVSGQLTQLIRKGLADYNADGEWVPLLATEVPDVANGGVSEDGLTVTWHLKPDLKWSDGTPLTSDDVRYTWEVCGNPKNACVKSAGLTDITKVETPDAQTIVLHYKRPFFGYKGQFRWGILPRHSPDTGDPKDIANWDYSRTANPTNGPFIVKEWVAGDHISLVRNPNYYEPGKPYLDGINIVFRGDQEAMRQMVMSGEAQVAPTAKRDQDVIQALTDAGMTIGSGSSPYQGRFSLNPWDPNDLTKPHPILGDPQVRQAILLGTNVDEVTYTWNFPGVYTPERLTSRFDLWGPEYACGLPPIPYDPDQANQILDSLGWVRGDDGIRVKDGVRMALRVTVYSGYGEEDNQVVWMDQLKQLGIEATADNVDASILYGFWNDNAPTSHGDYDLIYWEQGKDLGDPQTEAEQYYLSTNIPSADVPNGWNFARIDDPAIDDAINQAGATLDQTVRQPLLCGVADKVTNQMFAEEWFGVLPSFKYSRPELKGWHDAEQFTYFGQDAESWYLQPQP